MTSLLGDHPTSFIAGTTDQGMTDSPDNSTIGSQMHQLMERLFPICRSQTGNGVRESLRILQDFIPLQIHEVPTGTEVLDWQVPQEWNLREAWIQDPTGNKVVDLQDSTLHVVNGSDPVHATVKWSELKPHLHTLPEQPDLIPYRTSFFANTWGFCISQNQFDQLEDRGEIPYEVCINASRTDGAMTIGELVIPGESNAEVLISTHTCHPSLANDGISGIAVATSLGQWLARQPRRYTWRILFAPATIGAITWLALNERRSGLIRHGLVLSCIGDEGPFHYRRSRRGDTEIDRIADSVLTGHHHANRLLDFEPFGYDQRQFCSPGFDLPVGCLMRTPNGQFPEYHTSADDLSLVTPDALYESLEVVKQIAEHIEADYSDTWISLNQRCEPRLGKAGLYQAFGSRSDQQAVQQAIMWVLNFSDGRHSIRDISERSGITVSRLQEAAELLEQNGFLCAHTSIRRGPAAGGVDSFESTARQLQV